MLRLCWDKRYTTAYNSVILCSHTFANWYSVLVIIKYDTTGMIKAYCEAPISFHVSFIRGVLNIRYQQDGPGKKILRVIYTFIYI
jgi:hypothetical protein